MKNKIQELIDGIEDHDFTKDAIVLRLKDILATASEQAPVAEVVGGNDGWRGLSWLVGTDTIQVGTKLYTSPTHTSEARDSQRLEWLFDPNFYVGCRFDLGFYVECTLSGKVITSGHATHREAIDAAMRQEAE